MQRNVHRVRMSDWMQLGAAINSTAAFEVFGRSVSLSSDGTRVAIGGLGGAGKVRMYERTSSDWMQLGADINGQANDDNFGLSVSLSAVGTHTRRYRSTFPRSQRAE